MSLKLKTQRFGQFYCPLSSFFNARRRTIKLSKTSPFLTFLASKNPSVILPQPVNKYNQKLARAGCYILRFLQRTLDTLLRKG